MHELTVTAEWRMPNGSTVAFGSEMREEIRGIQPEIDRLAPPGGVAVDDAAWIRKVGEDAYEYHVVTGWLNDPDVKRIANTLYAQDPKTMRTSEQIAAQQRKNEAEKRERYPQRFATGGAYGRGPRDINPDPQPDDAVLVRPGDPYAEAHSRKMKLADECGILRTENDRLLIENAKLRRSLEAAERRLATKR